jgi:hypothetical protein
MRFSIAMAQFSKSAGILLLACLGAQAQTVIRQGGTPGSYPNMPEATLDAIPTLVLPPQYKDRTAHPLPASVDNSTKKYFPPHNWAINAYTCAHAVAVSYVYDFEANFINDVANSGSKPDYPYDYTYAFLNGGSWGQGGDGWSIVETIGVLRMTGAPTTADFGRFGGNNGAWMSGYDKYYKAMKLRAQDYKVSFSPAANDEIIKQYLYDHMDGSAAGGLFGFIANDEAKTTSGSANGHPIYNYIGPGGGHAMTIIGYDDAVAGGSYLVVDDFGEGFYWAPYKLFRPEADLYPQKKSDKNYDAQYDNNQYFFTSKIKKGYSPKFTFKINITHSARNKFCLMTGAASSTTAAEPTKSIDYQGAFNFAGGGSAISNLEIGLDLTDLTSVVAAGQGTFFLKVISTGGSGTINSIALEDYTGGTVKEIAGTGKAINGTILIAIPWTGSPLTGIGEPRVVEQKLDNTLRAAFYSGSNTVKFSFAAKATDKATLRVKDIMGRTVLARACSPEITAGMATETWDLKDNHGLLASQGTYIASVTLIGQEGHAKQLAAKVVVGN